MDSGNFDVTLTASGVPILNAAIDHVQVYLNPDDENNVWARFFLRQGGEVRPLPLLRAADLARLDLGGISPRYVCADPNGKNTDSAVRIVFRQAVSEEIQHGTPRYLFTRPGWNRLTNGSRVYVVGDIILGEMQTDGYFVIPEIAGITLPDHIERDTVELLHCYFAKLNRDPEVLLPLAAHLIRSLLASVFEEAGFPLRYILYLVGVQGSGKTTAATDFCLPFDMVETGDPAHVTRALDHFAGARDFLAARRDVPVLLDDVCTSSNASTQRESKDLAASIIRFAADRVPLHIKRKGETVAIRSQVGVTVSGEFPMSTPSDLTRCVIVSVNHQMRGREPDDRAVTAAIATRFLRYCAAHFDEIQQKISSELGTFDASASANSSPRQQQHLAELYCAFLLLLQFAEAAHALTAEESGTLEGQFHDVLNHCLSENNRLLKTISLQNLDNLACFLLENIENGQIALAKSQENYALDPDTFAGLRDKKLCYLKLQALAEFITSSTGRTWTANRVGQRLRECGLIEVGKESRSAKHKLPGLGRFVAIDIRTLKKQANPTSNS